MSARQVACTVCKTEKSIDEMWHCSCMELHFCSSKCAEQNPHANVEDELHAEIGNDVDIAANPFTRIRRRIRGDFSVAVRQLARDFIRYAKQVREDPKRYATMTGDFIDTFVGQVSSSRKDEFRRELNQYKNRLETSVYEPGPSEAMAMVLAGSNELMTLFHKETRIIRTSRKHALSDAWRYLNNLFLDFRFTETPDPAQRSIEDYVSVIGRMLAGGDTEFETPGKSQREQ